MVATVVRPFGRIGEVKAAVETDYPEAMSSRKKLYLLTGTGAPEERCVESIRFHQGALLVKLEGVDSIYDAEKLRGVALAIPDSDRASLEQGHYWLDEIVGLEVFTEEGEPLGKVTEVLRLPGNDVWVTDSAMIPAVADFVTEIDVEKGRITVKAVEGLRTGGD